MNTDSYTTPLRPIRPVVLQSDHDTDDTFTPTPREEDAQPEETFREADILYGERPLLELAERPLSDFVERPLLELADGLLDRARREGPTEDPGVFRFDIRVVPTRQLWDLTSTHYPTSRLQSCAEELMQELMPVRRPYLCKAILESTEDLHDLLKNPTRSDLKKAAHLMSLGKFAAEQWLALEPETPAPKRKRPE